MTCPANWPRTAPDFPFLTLVKGSALPQERWLTDGFLTSQTLPPGSWLHTSWLNAGAQLYLPGHGICYAGVA